MKNTITILAALSICLSSSAQPIASRIKAYADYSTFSASTLLIKDSVGYQWGANRGGDLDNTVGELKSDEREILSYNSSSVITFGTRFFETYNADNSIATTMSLQWDGTAYNNYVRDSLKYDANGNQISAKEQLWLSGAWENNFITIDSFDNNNRRIKRLQQQWVSGAWVNSALVNYTYNAAGKLTLNETFQWNSGTWNNYSKEENVYDANNNLITRTRYNGSGSTWSENKRDSYQYDVNNNNTVYTYYTYVAGWQAQYRYLYTYNADNLVTEQTYQSYPGSWTNVTDYVYTYYPSGSLQTTLYRTWNVTVWVNSTLTTNTYNADDFVINTTKQNWDGSTWVDNTKSTYTRNTDNQRTYILAQKLVSGAWNTTDESYFYYENYTPATGINDVPQVSNIKAYPNPFTVNTAIAFEMQQTGNLTISIYDIAGTLVKQEKGYYPAGSYQWLWDGNSTSGNNVSAGVYFVVLQSNGGQQTQKLIKTQ